MKMAHADSAEGDPVIVAAKLEVIVRKCEHLLKEDGPEAIERFLSSRWTGRFE